METKPSRAPAESGPAPQPISYPTRRESLEPDWRRIPAYKDGGALARAADDVWVVQVELGECRTRRFRLLPALIGEVEFGAAGVLSAA